MSWNRARRATLVAATAALTMTVVAGCAGSADKASSAPGDQGFTPPKELQPVDTTADTRSNTVMNCLIFMLTSTGTT